MYAMMGSTETLAKNATERVTLLGHCDLNQEKRVIFVV